jgi:hypothetical protein
MLIHLFTTAVHFARDSNKDFRKADNYRRVFLKNIRNNPKLDFSGELGHDNAGMADFRFA